MTLHVASCITRLTKTEATDTQNETLFALDFVMMFTALVVGILGLTSVIGMPLVASWACILSYLAKCVNHFRKPSYETI